MQVQWNHLNLDHALHFGAERCCPLPPIHSCLLSSHNMLHTVWGLLFKPMHPLTISHMYIITSHAPSASFICSTKPLPGKRLPCSWIFVSLCPHSVPHWSQPGCRTDMEVELCPWTCEHTTDDNDCPYSSHQLKEGLGSLGSDGWGLFR